MTVIYKVEVDENGNTFWYNQQGKFHREGGLPAIEYADGDKFWYVNGQLHREGGLHTIEFADGGKAWYVNDQLHREGGLPAVELANGGKVWYVNGHHVTEEQAKAMFSKPATCDGKVVEIDGKKFKLMEVI